jgi:hypothetical protein
LFKLIGLRVSQHTGLGGFLTGSRLRNRHCSAPDAAPTRKPRSTPQEPQQRGCHDRNHDARNDREVEVESIPNDMNVARQPTERNAREPVPSEAGKNAQSANDNQESVHGAQ